MQTAIVTDMHGYRPGLDALDRELADLQPDHVICLGDMIYGGGNDEHAIRWTQRHCTTVVRGNHDEDAKQELPTDLQAWVDQLPLTATHGPFHLVHDSPRAKSDKTKDPYMAWKNFDDADFSRCLVGHSHFSAVYRFRKGMGASSEELSATDAPHRFDPGYRYLCVIQSLAYNRKFDRSPGYAIYDDAQDTIEFKYLDVAPMETRP